MHTTDARGVSPPDFLRPVAVPGRLRAVLRVKGGCSRLLEATSTPTPRARLGIRVAPAWPSRRSVRGAGEAETAWASGRLLLALKTRHHVSTSRPAGQRALLARR